MASYKERMRQKLEAAFQPERLIIQDDSAQHAGHSGAHPDGETHFSIEIVAAAFDGLSRVAAQRAVYAAIGDEMSEHVHAVSLTVRGTSAR